MTARLLVTGARVLTPGGEWPRGWIAVEGRRIAAMGQGRIKPWRSEEKLATLAALWSMVPREKKRGN